MKQAYVKKTGEKIIGTYDLIPGTALINGFDDAGEPEYYGETDVHWDDQRQQAWDGKLVYVCESGQLWTLDDCEFREEGQEEDEE